MYCCNRAVAVDSRVHIIKKYSMKKATVLSVIESPAHPDFSDLYQRLGLHSITVSSMRKAISHAKKEPPDYLVAEFIYGYGNNYAGVNISNMDVLLYTLERYAPDTKVIALADKSERQYIDKLNDIIPLYAVLQLPVTSTKIESLLSDAKNE